jgi:hypothetical protein
MSFMQDLPDFDKLWNFDDPAATEAQLRSPSCQRRGNLPMRTT